MIKRLYKYFRGQLTEEQELQLWEKLLADDKAYLLLNLFLLFNESPGKSKQIEIPKRRRIG